MLSLVNIFHIIKKFPESRSSIEITGERSSPPKFIKVTVSTHDFIRIILSLIYFQDVNMNSNSEQAPPTINLNLNSDKTSSALYSNLGSGDQSYFNFEKYIVAWDVTDIETAAVMIVQSAYLSAGQRCTACRRLIVEDGAEGPLVDAITRLIDRIIVDEPRADPQPFMGPVIDLIAADILQDRFLGLMMKGGKAIRRLDRAYEERPYLTPALIDMTDAKDRLDEELFGPVLQIIRVKDFDAAIDEANATRFGLVASLIGGTPQMYDKFWANVRSGVINWNRPTNGAPSNAPFGGIGLSGNHRPSAYYAADYCAYPVTSVEADIARASIGEGLRDPEGNR